MHKKRELLAKGSCQNKKGTFFIDSGSAVSLVSPKFLSRIQKLGSVQHCNVVLSSFTQNKVPVQGKIVLEVRPTARFPMSSSSRDFWTPIS